MDKPDALSVTAGEIAALEVKVCGTPQLVPKWFKDGVELASGRKYKISFSKMISSLKVLSAERHDTGEYTFEVENEVGKDLSKINLTVLGWWSLSSCCFRIHECFIIWMHASLLLSFLYR